jgi:hypothetical protein
VNPSLERSRRPLAARIARAQFRQQIAIDTVAICRRICERARPDAATALLLHDTHARHARELGRHETAERAEERFDRELARLSSP